VWRVVTATAKFQKSAKFQKYEVQQSTGCQQTSNISGSRVGISNCNRETNNILITNNWVVMTASSIACGVRLGYCNLPQETKKATMNAQRLQSLSKPQWGQRSVIAASDDITGRSGIELWR